MKTLELEKLSPEVKATARMAESGVIVLLENGQPAFALVNVKDDLALEALALSRNEKFVAYLDSIRENAKHGRTYSLRELRAEFSIAEPRPRRKRRSTDK